MSRILCIMDGMTDPGFCPEEYPYLSSMKFSCQVDTCRGGEPETLSCVLALLGVKEPTENLRGYVEALGAGIPVRKGALFVRASWFSKDEKGRLTEACEGPKGLLDPRFSYYNLGENRGLFVFPGRGREAEGIVTKVPDSVFLRQPEEFLPGGSDRLMEVFLDFQTKERCVILWGQAEAASIPPFSVPAAMVCGKSLLRGIGRLLSMDVMEVFGASGDEDTDQRAKAEAALSAARRYPFVVLHVNGADEAAHRRDPEAKRQFLKRADLQIFSRLLRSGHEIIVTSDHGTDPVSGKHLANPQPVFTKV